MNVSFNVNPKRHRVVRSTIGADRFGILSAVRRFPLLEPQQEYMLAKSWRAYHANGSARSKYALSRKSRKP